ncbi:MAG: hypothetical protein M1814_001565 [Vezdaea aestivalis]|nr:MAG: hypothetical protein M1814_001565 [Vezdaea aestivalis]
MAVPLQKPPLRTTRRTDSTANTKPDPLQTRNNKRDRTHLDQDPHEHRTPKRHKLVEDVCRPREPPKARLLQSAFSPKVVSRTRRAAAAAEAPLANGSVETHERLDEDEDTMFLQQDSQDTVQENGTIRIEQGVESSPKRERRMLRSQDSGSRIKSELALYFPCYDELLGNEIKPPGTDLFSNPTLLDIDPIADLLHADSILFIIDDPPSPHETSSPPKPKSPRGPKSPRNKRAPLLPNGIPPPPPFDISSLVDAKRIDFPTSKRVSPQPQYDPLPSELFHKAHRRAERQEKQLRNIEREHAQHEKAQLERLLDGLRGHDWLRIMGVSGITESEKKALEPKRDMFIGEVEGLIEKFRVWKEEEKRRKGLRALEREEAAAAAAEEADELEDTDALDPSTRTSTRTSTRPPSLTDLDADAFAARQLQEEASAIRPSPCPLAPARTKKPLRKPNPQPSTLKTKPGPRKPSTSTNTTKSAPLTSKRGFPTSPLNSPYSKPYLRAATEGRSRRSGRGVAGYGDELPLLNGHKTETVAESLGEKGEPAKLPNGAEKAVGMSTRSRGRRMVMGD